MSEKRKRYRYILAGSVLPDEPVSHFRLVAATNLKFTSAQGMIRITIPDDMTPVSYTPLDGRLAGTGNRIDPAFTRFKLDKPALAGRHMDAVQRFFRHGGLFLQASLDELRVAEVLIDAVIALTLIVSAEGHIRLLTGQLLR